MSDAAKQISYEKRKSEIIDGKIYLMASPCREHRDVQGNLLTSFNIYFNQSGKKCRAFFDSDFVIDKDNKFEPDLKVLCRDNGNVPVIVVEVLSNSTRDRDLGIKMEKYAAFGIKEYWVITWELSLIDIYMLSEEKIYRHHKSYTLKSDDEDEATIEFSPKSFPEMKIALTDVFNIWVN